MSSETQAADPIAIRDNKLTLVERLADDLAHEIKNPLHSMVINLEVLRRRIARTEIEPTEDLLRYTQILNTEIERVNRRVDLLLQMVRPNSDSDDLTTLQEIVDELLEILELECERQGVALHTQLPPVPFRATLPRATVRQIILCLALKTLDSLSKGGAVEISAEVTSDGIQVRCGGSRPDGQTLAALPSFDEDPYIHTAWTLAREIGGELRLLTVGANGLTAPSRGGSHYSLSLPAAT